jgi:hypothetical protein
MITDHTVSILGHRPGPRLFERRIVKCNEVSFSVSAEGQTLGVAFSTKTYRICCERGVYRLACTISFVGYLLASDE